MTIIINVNGDALTVELLDTLGKRIETLRKNRGWLQVDLARASGVRQNYISMIENDNASPSATSVAAIAKALGASLDFIMLLSETPTTRQDWKPTYYSQQAEAAADIIDVLPEEWRDTALEGVKRVSTEWREIQRQDEELTELLRRVEAAGGGVARAILEDYVRSNLDALGRRSSRGGVVDEPSSEERDIGH